MPDLRIRQSRILIRRGSENVELLGETLRQALLEQEYPGFDDRSTWDASLDDLDPTRVDWYLQRAAQERGLPVDPSLPLERIRAHPFPLRLTEVSKAMFKKLAAGADFPQSFLLKHVDNPLV